MKNNIIAIFMGVLTLLAIMSIYSLNNLYSSAEELQKLRDNRFLMIAKADEFRQSSEDLTRFARTYVVTADEKYKNNYFDILDIRDGLLERPYYYEGIYWDLLEPIRSQRHRPNVKEVLEDKMKELPFMENELKFLSKGKMLSDELSGLEVEAFNAMEGMYKDAEGEYTVEGSANQKLAIELLFSHKYHISKADIMLPIDDFLFLFTKRTSLEIQALQKEFKYSFLVSVLSIMGFILSVFFFALVEKKRIKRVITGSLQMDHLED